MFTVGDTATMAGQSDLLTGVEERVYPTLQRNAAWTTIRTGSNSTRAMLIADLMGNLHEGRAGSSSTPRSKRTPSEFQVGKKWTAAFRRTREREVVRTPTSTCTSSARETISGAGGTLRLPSRIEGRGLEHDGQPPARKSAIPPGWCQGLNVADQARIRHATCREKSLRPERTAPNSLSRAAAGRGDAL
jgi:hypothetical protein